MSAIDEELAKVQDVADEMETAALKLKDGSPMRAKLLRWAHDMRLAAEIAKQFAASQAADYESARAHWLEIIAREARDKRGRS